MFFHISYISTKTYILCSKVPSKPPKWPPKPPKGSPIDSQGLPNRVQELQNRDQDSKMTAWRLQDPSQGTPRPSKIEKEHFRPQNRGLKRKSKLLVNWLIKEAWKTLLTVYQTQSHKKHSRKHVQLSIQTIQHFWITITSSPPNPLTAEKLTPRYPPQPII